MRPLLRSDELIITKETIRALLALLFDFLLGLVQLFEFFFTLLYKSVIVHLLLQQLLVLHLRLLLLVLVVHGRLVFHLLLGSHLLLGINVCVWHHSAVVLLFWLLPDWCGDSRLLEWNCVLLLN